MKKFNYKKMISQWDNFDQSGERIPYGQPSDELVERAQKMASIIIWKTDYGITLNDLPDTYWPDHLWDIEHDEELLRRVKEILNDLIDETIWSEKDKRKTKRNINDVELDEMFE